MINEIYVNGYRSLEDIRIPLKIGLNILVGPNGGGKTNILSHFEFLSKLVALPVDEAVSSHGGIGRVFARRPHHSFNTHLNGSVSGQINFTTKGGLRRPLWYTWQYEIISSDSYEEIAYGNQKLFINIGTKPKTPEFSDLILVCTRGESGYNFTIEKMVIARIQHFFRGIPIIDVGTYFSAENARKFILYNSRQFDLDRRCIINCFSPQLSLIRRIAMDISGAEIFNFVPEICKQPEDSARPPMMEKTGAGLASTLHKLSRSPSEAMGPRRVLFRSSSGDGRKLEKISSYVKLINSSVSKIYTQKNHIDNTISVFISIIEPDGEVEFPLSQCSDGTVKWIALVTKVITAGGGFSIEEPENFLHPSVQKEFLEVVRAESKESESSPYTLLTTHSESLLNEARPEEVILVWMDGGKTVAKRVANHELLVEEINKTGFGLGYYYTSGALEGA